ncbi:hypothetical protein [Streptomyces sp. NPDC088789]|uniref:hypothetical protein n=1 Tax=Streptomyces sp. NPDC088789 TaxID=3365899 RepID=UPI0037F989AF
MVAAWAGRERRTKEALFHSTSATDRASRSVARVLGLIPLGWIWTVRQDAGGGHQAQSGTPAIFSPPRM